MNKEDNVNSEKENFIEEKAKEYGEQKLFDKESIKIFGMFVIEVILIFLVIIASLYLKNKKIVEIIVGIPVIFGLISAISFFRYSKKVASKSTSNSKEIPDLYDIFIKDFLKKYSQKSFSKMEQIKDLKKDFSAIIDYENSALERMSYFYVEPELETDDELIKLSLNDSKDIYLYKESYTVITSNGYRVNRKRLSLFLKLNIDDRICIKTKVRDFQSQKEVFEKSFLDRKEYIIEYDSKNFKELDENLSEEFYHANFGEKPGTKAFEIDEILKRKILDIYNKYNVQFSFSLKNNLFRIEFGRDINRFDIGSYSYIYDMEKTASEILEIFLELERVNNNIRLSDIDYSKVKNLIFDLDNTIILDTEEDSEYYREALINAGFTDDYFYGIYQAIDEYDKIITEDEPYYDENKLLEFINEYLEQEFNLEVIKEIKAVAGREWTKRVIIPEEVLEYLSSKYNLYVYTNYFQDVQEERIKNIGYSKYFKKVFGADKYGCKQFKKCFEGVLKEINAKPEECLMIGDDKSRDILGANNLNMKSILYDYNNKRDKKEIVAKDYTVIKNMNELKKIL
ncbi:MAG: HAD family hydrolase [Clostridia bacterium]|nr:HAD family hydrolase [Clostridia bacterium]